MAVGLTQPPIEYIPALFPAIKRPELVADHSPPLSTEVKNAGSYISSLPIRLHIVVLS